MSGVAGPQRGEMVGQATMTRAAASDGPGEPINADYALRGRSIIAGEPAEAPEPAESSPGTPPDPAGAEPDAVFRAIDPGTGKELPTRFVPARPQEVDRAAWQAWQAFYALSERPPEDRAALLEMIADQIVRLGDLLISTAADETGLGPARLVSERDRTVNTLRMFAEVVRDGEWVQAAIDTAQPSRRPIPKPDIRRMLRPLGPVAVFGAGNFPLAYSTAGGDTASALAAGCPVVVKGHPGHPGTGELVAQAVARAVESLDFHPGTFSFLHAGPIAGPREFAVGEQLVQHPAIRAVGFTGSFAGGMALARLAAGRPDPIPVFAEMGSVNPVFVLPGAAESQSATIADRLIASMTNSNGQMCTAPGLLFGVRSSGLENLLRDMAESLERAVPQPMLNHRVRANYARRVDEVAKVQGVDVRGGSPNAGHMPAQPAGEAGQPEEPQPPPVAPGDSSHSSPVLFRTTYTVFRRSPALHEEIFGPGAIAVICESEQELADAAAAIHASLTGTIWASTTDEELARRIASVLEPRVGRLIYNGVPTGVEVCPSMVHGGPFPATNQPHTTAVGPFAIQRWSRPVCYQNAPDSLLPPELQSENPLQIVRLVNGEWSDGPIEAR